MTVFCKAEIERYSRLSLTPKSKFIWQPTCSDVLPPEKRQHEEDYLFTGGQGERDYETLFRSVDGLPVVLRVAADRNRFLHMTIPANVKLLGWLDRDQYLDQLMRSRAFVLSLDTKSRDASIRFPGSTAIVTAMRYGKCIVVNDLLGAASYVDSGTHGILCEPQDPATLRTAINQVLHDEELRVTLGNNAATRGMRDFGFDSYFNYLALYTNLSYPSFSGDLIT